MNKPHVPRSFLRCYRAPGLLQIHKPDIYFRVTHSQRLQTHYHNQHPPQPSTCVSSSKFNHW